MNYHDDRRQGQDKQELRSDGERRGAAGRGDLPLPGSSPGSSQQPGLQFGGHDLSDDTYGSTAARAPQDPHAGQGNPDPSHAYANSSGAGHLGYDQNHGNYRGRDALDDRGDQGRGEDPVGSSPHRYGTDRGDREDGSGGYASANNPDNHGGEAPSPELYSQYGLARQDKHEFQHDPEYHQWRSEQMRKLDNEYREWRKQRYDKFSEDFNSWRSRRPAPDGGAAAAASGPAPTRPPPCGSEPGIDSAGRRTETDK